MIRPMTLVECDEQILLTQARYLRAARAWDFPAALRFYNERDELLEQRPHLPQQRSSPEGGASCTGSRSRRSA